MFRQKRLLPNIIWFLTLLSLPFGTLAFAQDDEDDEDDEEQTEEEESTLATQDMEEMVVTGSRLIRSTYSNISPLQIVDSEYEREAGLVDTAEILQKTTQAQGQQIDLTYTGYVLDNGPAASTISLRGLGASRSLVLINGRRLAPAGVEGAPSTPDLNLVPAALVQQYELLLDGASSVYGSDAVAGVVNVILTKDFDGLEVNFFGDVDQFSGKYSNNLALKWGQNYDRGFFGMALNYDFNEAVTRADSPHYAGCSHEAEITQDGEIRKKSLWFEYWYDMEWDDCGYSGLQGAWVTGVPFGPLFYTPGRSNGGWKDFSISRIRLAGQWFWTDEDGDGFNDVTWRDHAADANEQFATLIPEFRRVNFMSYGEYTFDGDANVTPFYEFTYGSRESEHNGGGYQVFPSVHPLNPFNPCNPLGEGVDCGLAINEFFAKQSFRDMVIEALGCDPGPGGSCDLSQRPRGPVPAQPVVVIEGDRNITTVEVAQTRYVGGVRFDMPWLTWGSRGGWTAEFFISYTDSSGSTYREGIHEDRMAFALGNLSLAGVPCQASPGAPIAAEDMVGCVPVNLFAPSVMDFDHQGAFATQAERDYLFVTREFDTTIEQTLVSYYMTGNLYELQGGTVAAGFGAEWRKDEIDSIPNQVAADGKFIHFSADQGAAGSKNVQEAFGEIEFPLIGNMRFANELTVNLSTRYTEEEYSGDAWTYSTKVAWRPVSSLLIRGTKGTSFRAPNLRELFLRAQTGFLSVFDPCAVPTAAIDPITNEYIPEQDRREPHVLENCRNNGADPLALIDGFTVYSVEIASGGALDLLPETSQSETWGFSFRQPFTNAFDLAIGGTVYDISIDDTIVEPSAGFIISDCYNSETGNSPYCQRITRETDGPPRMTYIHQGFINRDNETVRGIDLNVAFSDTITLFDRPIQFGIDYITHKLLERSDITITAEETRDEDVSEWYYPRYRHRLTFRAQFNQMRLSWNTRVLGRQDQHDDFEDDWGSVPDRRSDTCLGPEEGDVLCRDIGSTDFYWIHSVSFSMARRDYVVNAGIRNVFDVEPPFVDGSEVFSRSNVPIGAGYDVLGRAAFMSFTYRLGGVL